MSQLLELEPVLIRQLSARKTASRPSTRPSRRERDPEPVGLLDAPILESASGALELDAPLVAPLRRPEPRTETRRPVAVPVMKPRPGLIKGAVATVAGVALFCCAGQIAAFAMAPVISSMRTGAEIQSYEKKIQQLKQSNEVLAMDVAYWSSSLGREEQARRRGYLGKNEVSLVPILPEGVQLAKPSVEVAKPAEHKSVSQRIRETVDTCLANLGGGRRK